VKFLLQPLAAFLTLKTVNLNTEYVGEGKAKKALGSFWCIDYFRVFVMGHPLMFHIAGT